MSDAPKPVERPLSPHLQVYRLPMEALMSISHRMTGVVNMGGSLLVAAVLIAAALGPDEYRTVMGFLQSTPGTIILFLWSLALFYHLCNGIRHLIWDTGRLFSKKAARVSGWIVLYAAFGLTAATWYCVGTTP